MPTTDGQRERMQCLKCPMVTAAGRLNVPAGVLTMHPALEFLCTEHFKAFEQVRTAKAIREHRESRRLWCGCGRELYMAQDARGLPRTACEACRLGLGPPTPPDASTAFQAVHGAVAPARGVAPRCYGNSGDCPKTGELYPAGTWCEDHPPPRPYWIG